MGQKNNWPNDDTGWKEPTAQPGRQKRQVNEQTVHLACKNK